MVLIVRPDAACYFDGERLSSRAICVLKRHGCWWCRRSNIGLEIDRLDVDRNRFMHCEVPLIQGVLVEGYVVCAVQALRRVDSSTVLLGGDNIAQYSVLSIHPIKECSCLSIHTQSTDVHGELSGR